MSIKINRSIDKINNKIDRISNVINGLSYQITLLNKEIGYLKHDRAKQKRKLNLNKKSFIDNEKLKEANYVNAKNSILYNLEKYYYISIEDLIKEDREYSDYRYAVFLALLNRKCTKVRISKDFYRSRATIKYGAEKIEFLIKTDNELKQIYKNITKNGGK